MKSVALVLLLVSLGVGYFLFVNKEKFDSSSVMDGVRDYSSSASESRADVNDHHEENIEFKYGGEASKPPQRRGEALDEEEREASSSIPPGQEHRHDSNDEDEEEDHCIPNFTRDYIMECEGYYRSAEDADEDLPWPRSNKNNWPCPEHKSRWMAKLKRIEASSPQKSISDPHHSVSRLEKKALGNKIFVSREKNKEGHSICWTQDLLGYYVDKFDIVPSEEFYYWVLDLEL